MSPPASASCPGAWSRETSTSNRQPSTQYVDGRWTRRFFGAGCCSQEPCCHAPRDFFFFLLGPGSASLRYRVGQANGRANEVGVAGRWAARQSPRAQTMMASSPPHPVPATQQPPRHGSIRGRAGGLSKTGVSGLRRTGLAPRVIGTYPLPQDDVVRVGRRGVGDGSLAVPRPINLDRLDASPTSPVPARRRGRQKQEFGVGAVSSEFSLGQWCQHWTRGMNKAMGHKGHLQNILNPDMERALPNPWRKETNPASCTEDGTRRKGPSSQALGGGGGGGGSASGLRGHRGEASIVHLGGVGPSLILIWE